MISVLTHNSETCATFSQSNESCAVNVGDTERLVSGVTGASLIAAGVAKGSFAGLFLTALGAGLVYRGVSGNCGLYRMLGISTNCTDSLICAQKEMHDEELIDESLEESFPASDPPSSSAVTR
jgi:uncharacterized membrane protein